MDNNEENRNKLFGLLGKNISYSFSRGYFTEKFNTLKLPKHTYVNFDIPSIEDFPKIITENKTSLSGINVTIPYKEAVLAFLDEIDEDAKNIGAVNTIKVLPNLRLKGYNTDVYGFKNSLQPFLKSHHKKALILGTGGASKAVAYAFKQLEIDFLWVSRNPKHPQEISYAQLTEEIIKSYAVIVNCSPVGTFPNVTEAPAIPYQYLTSSHILFDLIYNPEETTFLSKGKEQGAQIKNGYEMLALQAEKSWEIWNKNY